MAWRAQTASLPACVLGDFDTYEEASRAYSESPEAKRFEGALVPIRRKWRPLPRAPRRVYVKWPPALDPQPPTGAGREEG